MKWTPRVRWTSLSTGGLALVIVSAGTPRSALAANGSRPRTPAVFPTVPCLETVNLQQADTFSFEYSVPYDDIELTDDELSDSRRLQFFAWSAQRFDFQLPNWITEQDYARALENGDVTEPNIPPEILETDQAWAGKWVRITPDEARKPITASEAARGVQWDVRHVSPGSWQIAAYTWEPENNLWSHRFGAIQLINGSESPPPAAYLAYDPGRTSRGGEELTVTGCISASSGTQVEASWGLLEGRQEPQWTPISTWTTLSGPSEVNVSFPTPNETGNIKVRLALRTAAGEELTVFSPAPIAVQSKNSTDATGCRCGRSIDPIAPLWLVLLPGFMRVRKPQAKHGMPR